MIFLERWIKYADDGALMGRNVQYVQKKLQGALNKVENWSVEWGFKISISKTKYVVLRRYTRPL